MEEAMASRYWCHMCSQMVNPIMEVEIKCPFCHSGFVEEMSNSSARDNDDPSSDFGSERALSLWAPILLGMMGNPRRHRRFRQLGFDGGDDDDDNDHENGGVESQNAAETTELDRELESIIRSRRRSSATILQLLQGIRAGMTSELENNEGDRDRVILINPFNQTIVVERGNNENQNPIGSLGDYFIGPGLDMLLQHLAENDPNRYGTPPAEKEAVEALPTVVIKENLQCSVCLDDFEIGTEAMEMPCKHKFHGGCILPWLELHSSCPVCRHQLPANESKRDSEAESWDISTSQREEEGGEGDGRSESGRRFSFPWPFNGLFSSSGSQSGGTNSSSSAANGGGSGNGAQTR